VGDEDVTQVITVRYFAGARAAAGVEEEELPINGPHRLRDLTGQLGQRHGAALSRVLATASFLVDETAGAPDRVIQAGSVVDVLPPFAGG
jgi:sulfur-carrier protein